MKKTLITLLALSCVSMGATIGTIDKKDTTLKAYWDFTESNALTAGSVISWSELPTWNAAGYGESTTSSTHPYTESAGLRAADGFTVSFDINGAGVGTLLSMTSGGMTQAWRTITVTLAASEETDGASILSAQFHGNTEDAVAKTLILSDTDWTTLTLVGSVDKTAASTLVLDFYIDGEHIGKSSTASATNITGGNVINKMQFGYYGTSVNSASTNIDNILVYGRALSAAEVKALTVPEPTTATLSLLALAGLVARRRRK